MFDLRLFELALEKNFQSHNLTITLFSGQINMAKIGPPMRFPNLEIRQYAPLLVGTGSLVLAAARLAIAMAGRAARRGRRHG